MFYVPSIQGDARQVEVKLVWPRIGFLIEIK